MILYPEIKRIPLQKSIEEKLMDILISVSKKNEVSIKEIRSQGRKQEYVFARWAFVNRASKITNDMRLITDMINRHRSTYHFYINDYRPYKDG